MTGPSNLNRRDFLKTAGLALGAAVFSPLLSAAGPLPADIHSDLNATPAAASQVRYRGTPDGKVLKSDDGGSSWRTLTNFGPQYAVDDVWLSGDGLFARLRFAGDSFTLRSQDERIWHTTTIKSLYIPVVLR